MLGKRLAIIALSAGLLGSTGCSFSCSLFPGLANRLGSVNSSPAPAFGGGAPASLGGIPCDAHLTPVMEGPMLPPPMPSAGCAVPTNGGDIPLGLTPRIAPQANPSPYSPTSSKTKSAS